MIFTASRVFLIQVLSSRTVKDYSFLVTFESQLLRVVTTITINVTAAVLCSLDLRALCNLGEFKTF